MKKFFLYFVIYYLRFFAKITLFIGKPKIIGIAGSVGKSSTKQALYAVLHDYFRTKFTAGNSETGVPLGVLGIKIIGFSPLDWLRVLLSAPWKIFNLRGTEILIVEMGIDEPDPPRNMEYLLTIVKPQIVIYLNALAAHTEQFEKVLTAAERFLPTEKKLPIILHAIAVEDAKIIIMSGCREAIINSSDKLSVEVLAEYKNSSLTKFYDFNNNKDDGVNLKKYSISSAKTSFTFSTKQGEIAFELNSFMLPEEYGDVFAPVVIASQNLGLNNQQIKYALEKNLELPKSRSSLLSGINQSIIIDSSYNASRGAVLAFLKLLKNIKIQEKRDSVFVFGDMRELGDEAEKEHQSLIKDLLNSVDYLYCVGTLTRRFIYEEIKKRNLKNKFKDLKSFNNSLEAGEYLRSCLPGNSIVLVKGSQNEIFLEELIKMILLNPKDQEKLCRQNTFWLRKKSAFFRQVV